MFGRIAKAILCFIFVFTSSFVYAQGWSIKEYLERVLPTQEGRKIVLNESLGLLTVTDTPSNHKLIKELIESWDVGPRQVAIEARFVEVSVSALGELGVEWMAKRSDTAAGGNLDRRKKNSTFFIGPGVTSTRPTNETAATNPATIGDTIGVLSGTKPNFSGTEFGAPAELAGLGLWIGKTTLDGSQLFSYLRALESTGKANLLSAPKVTTLSGQMANIELAKILPYATSVDQTYSDLDKDGTVEENEVIETYTVDEKKVGIFLEVTPVVGEQGNTITLDIHPEVSQLIEQKTLLATTAFPEDLGWPVIDTRSTQTSVTIESGETIVIGGLIKDDEDITIRRVPVLGYIPILGNLFKYKHSSRVKTNLVIFLTATMISAEGEEMK